VVTSLEFTVHPVGPDVLTGGVFYPAAQGFDVLRRWRDTVTAAPEDLATLAVLLNHNITPAGGV
jgi:hypothetical protein